MKCKKCKTKNIIKASYCKNCKEEFTEKEQEKAYKKTIYYYLEKIEEWYNHLTLSTITDHILFKIGSLLIVLGIGLYYFFTFGINTSILKSNSYEVYYNKKRDEYYLATNKKDKIKLNLYIPNRVKKLEIKHYDISNKLIDTIKQKKKDKIVLKNNKDDYYVIISKYGNKKTTKIKLLVYNKEQIENLNNK